MHTNKDRFKNTRLYQEHVLKIRCLL